MYRVGLFTYVKFLQLAFNNYWLLVVTPKKWKKSQVVRFIPVYHSLKRFIITIGSQFMMTSSL